MRMTTTTVLGTTMLLLAAGCGGASTGADVATPAPPVATQISPPADGAPPEAAPVPSPVRPKPGMRAVRKVEWDKVEPSPDGRTLTVVWSSGVEPCFVLDRVEVAETAREVTVTLYEGREGPADTACIAISFQKSTTVKLKAPLGDREVVDGAKA
ncbi:hypothetical protein [Sphaerisporangium sp. TRM90804]|uniref:hypothetical protein n=1 Tax=Sphaerisporangium sp. TRM90804 TaxID=3031113 RepID=UPI002446EFE0|nr:hypothetical protein [Sphaerisporangium sp. TRM90804]MDH2426767.1 hypothetical protein [Sphaerisporangium sp. TRM90804]